MTEDGFFSAGDVAIRDSDGYYSIVDRVKDMIISGGMNVYSREIEEVLAAHPAAADVAIVGIPDAHWGERVVGVVQLTADAEPTTDLAAGMVAFCRQRLAAYKCPKEIKFIEALPRTAIGKVQKNMLRDNYRLLGDVEEQA
jgi:acyl-CoA synthetase (AMP-forming)/AMP-acid ligase II